MTESLQDCLPDNAILKRAPRQRLEGKPPPPFSVLRLSAPEAFGPGPGLLGSGPKAWGDLSGRQGFLPSTEHAHKQFLGEETPRPRPESRLLSCSFPPLGAGMALTSLVSPALFLSACVL